jgi:hypothetical protein
MLFKEEKEPEIWLVFSLFVESEVPKTRGSENYVFKFNNMMMMMMMMMMIIIIIITVCYLIVNNTKTLYLVPTCIQCPSILTKKQ